MIHRHEDLIIVAGMAHSGTTILTYLLKQHPDIVCATNGQEAWILENDWLAHEQAGPIQKILEENPGKKILLKRPWSFTWHSEWMLSQMPDAKYLYCAREFDKIRQSWMKPTSFIEPDLRNGTIEYQRNYFDFCTERGDKFRKSVKHFKYVHHSKMLEDPLGMMDCITNWLRLREYTYDLSMVSETQNIKDILGKQ